MTNSKYIYPYDDEYRDPKGCAEIIFGFIITSIVICIAWCVL